MLSFYLMSKTSFSTGVKVMANPLQQPTPPPEKPQPQSFLTDTLTPTPVGVKTRSGESVKKAIIEEYIINVNKKVKLTETDLKQGRWIDLLSRIPCAEKLQQAIVNAFIGEVFCGGSDFAYKHTIPFKPRVIHLFMNQGILLKPRVVIPADKLIAFFVPYIRSMRSNLFFEKILLTIHDPESEYLAKTLITAKGEQRITQFLTGKKLSPGDSTLAETFTTVENNIKDTIQDKKEQDRLLGLLDACQE